MSLRVLVVDDEDLPRQRVRNLVAAHPALTLIGEASDGAAALDLIAERLPDLVFLDIQMPELDGFQVIAALDDEFMPAIVFVTAFDQYAIRAFEVDAIDYLLKPITNERFEAAVQRVLSRRRGVGELAQVRALAARMIDGRRSLTRFVARRSGKHYFVPLADVDWLESDGNYLRLYVGETTHLVRDTMKVMELRLDPSRYVRIHRSMIVAIDRIRSIEGGEHGEYVVTMQSGRRLTSSRSYSERLRRLLR